eukprot:15319128-Ditylum_brightwellii.AAC.1
MFILIDYLEPHRRRNAVSMEKFFAAQCLYKKKQLDIRLNTKFIAVGLMADKKASGHLIRKNQDICSVAPERKYIWISSTQW